MIDELLTTFRCDVAEPDRKTAGRIYALAAGSGRRAHLRFRPRLLLGVAAAALVLVPTAVAFGGKLADLFEGTPAPPDVSTAFAESNRMADKIVQQGFASQWPHADVSKAHGVIEIQTPDGPEDLWAAPDDQGGQCSFIDFADDPPGKDGIAGFGDCPRSAPQPDETIDFGDVWTYVHPSLMTIYGSVYRDATTVRLTFEDGSTATLPVVEHFFLGSAAQGVKVDSVAAFDAAGNQVAARTLRPSGSTRG
ncbi:MAG TPA: hypothetical protein VH541_00390 [Gaiellaceae bacterium]|jgi:hypothetical protein